MTEEEREYDKVRSDVWIPLFKNCSENGGIISKTDQNIVLTVQNIALTVSTKVFDVAIHSIKCINFEDNPTVLITTNAQHN